MLCVPKAHGPVELLGSVGTGTGFDELLPHTAEVMFTPDLTVRVLHLETFIELKEETSREKDRAALPILRRTLEERNRS